MNYGILNYRTLFSVAALLFLGWRAVVVAHPLQAEPINHAYVFTFDQFHLAEDGEESLTQGGLLLMAETRCLACHAGSQGWQERLAPAPGPNLAGVGSRLDADALWLLVRSPQHRKKGTLMPGLFSGAEDDPERVEALVQYLMTLKAPVKPMPEGKAERGKLLYHTVGCVACHDPALDYRPPAATGEAVLERPGNASVPIALADAYELNALGRYLLNPHETHPAGRMPSLRLTEQEAADIATYLHLGRTPEKAVERAALKITPQTADTGREIFVQQRCNACHRTGEPMTLKPAKPLVELNATAPGSCLAEQPAAGMPRFDFNPLQRQSLALALKLVQAQPPEAQEPMQQLDWQMQRLNCYACHDRDGKGGPEDPRALYFIASAAGLEPLGDLARFPPTLDRVGWKLTPSWLHRLLHGEGGSVRPYLSARMPNFGEANTAKMPDWFREADKPAEAGVLNVKAPFNPEYARQLMGTKGLSCVNCHGLKDHKALQVPVINLTHTVERLDPGYFKALMLHPSDTQPLANKPALFEDRPKAGEEIEQLWLYLQHLDDQPLPEGMK